MMHFILVLLMSLTTQAFSQVNNKNEDILLSAFNSARSISAEFELMRLDWASFLHENASQVENDADLMFPIGEVSVLSTLFTRELYHLSKNELDKTIFSKLSRVLTLIEKSKGDIKNRLENEKDNSVLKSFNAHFLNTYSLSLKDAFARIDKKIADLLIIIKTLESE